MSLLTFAESHCEPTAPMEAPIVAISNGALASRIDRTDSPDSEGDQALLGSFSPQARQVATIIGVQGLLTEMRRLELDLERGIQAASVRLMVVRQELSDRLLLALFETTSVAAELECEKARAEDLAARLEEIRNDIQQRRTVLAILADSISGVFAGTFLLLGSEVLSGIIDLSGSIGALGFGVAALGGDQVYELRHRTNLMAPVWHGHEPGDEFPAAVWRYLNSPVRERSSRTRRDTILGGWRARLGKPESKVGRRRIQLLFGEGGVYRINELRYRGEMLGLLKTHINLMTQDLNLLFRETLNRREFLVRSPAERSRSGGTGEDIASRSFTLSMRGSTQKDSDTILTVPR
jgi:hypothetical protein